MSALARRSRFILLTCALASAGGCAPARMGRESGAHAIPIRVENEQFEQVTIYVLRATVPIRLGVVDGFQARTFHVPAGVGFSHTLVLRGELRISRQSQVSPPFDLGLGQGATWTLRRSRIH